jgi:glycogen(starch) synthase
MRILTVGNMYPPHSLGGYELIWESWVRHAEAQGHQVRVLTTDFRLDAPGGEAVAGDVHRTLRWYWRDHELPRFSAAERWGIERHNAELIERELAEFQPDVVAWWAMAGMSLSPIERVRRAGIPAIAVLGDFWLEYAHHVDAWTRTFLERPRLGRAVERLTGQITGVDMVAGIKFVFVSETLRRRAHERWPNLTESEVVPHPPPGVERFAEAPPAPWGSKLLYVGRIDPRKGIHLAIQALALLEPETTLAVVGDGDPRHFADLRGLVIRLGLGDRVAFGRRPREELPAVYAEADAVLFPVTWEEPFGLVPLEAMAVGRPVVATGRGGSGEYLEDGVNCLLFDPDQGAEPLAGRVRELAADSRLRDTLRAGGRDTLRRIVAARFNERVLATAERAAAEAATSR